MKRPLVSIDRTDLPSLAEAIGQRLQATAVFGPPVTQKRTTVVPVARARFGLGRSGRSGGPGAGAGGGASIRPAGFIVLEKGRARWRPIRNGSGLGTVVLFAAAAGAAALAVAFQRRPLPKPATTAAALRPAPGADAPEPADGELTEREVL